MDPAAFGYSVEEYQLRGVAACYQRVADHPAARIAVEELSTAPYCTRLLIMRPTDPTRFNHTVLLNWQNVSAGFEMPAPSEGELYEGYVWVGVSAQEVGLYGPPAGMGRGMRPTAKGLVDEDPERYGVLRHPGDQGSFDIFADAGRVVGPARSTAVDPLAGLDVHHVIAVGGSQSAMRLVAYANALHHRHRVIDGYVLSVWEGRAPDLMDGPISYGGGRTIIREDLDVPVVVVNSEFETLALHLAGAVDSEWIRYWEVAGTPHGVTRRSDLPHGRGWEPNALRFAPIAESAIRHVRRWLTEGRPAPSFPRIEVDQVRPPRIRRDAHGNAVGGIRLPELEAPVAQYRGSAGGTGLPPLFGAARPFGHDDLRVLYPTRRVMEDRWQQAVDVLVASEAIRPEDGTAMARGVDRVRLPPDGPDTSLLSS
ncbi:MAG TPA: alpha/beta hydrolase domain-containing protein [Acidimicrobiales bacterium]|nr:alpha/beta hydrolase domain-containing protein [Acidimicrobiales bacterium]